MRQLGLERKPLGAIDVDLCGDCQTIWFDAFESPQLTTGSVLALFRALQDAGHGTRGPLPARLPCPRCGLALCETHDLRHATRFTYWRCPRGHGRLTPFVQFLREKDFIRPLSDAELARLKSAVKIVRCGSCGAPVDIERSTVCGYCRSPILVLDPSAVASRVAELSSGERSTPPPDPDRLVDALMAMERERGAARRDLGSVPIVDLLELGVAALSRLLSR
jgi:DNA-directed RNA polymerase subunit RPC12/RpoP